MMNLLCYKVIYFRPNNSRNFKMAAVKTLFDHLIVPINPNSMMTTYVSSSYSLSSVMFSNILAQMPRHSPQSMEQSNPLCDRNSTECHIPSYSCIALLSVALLEQHPCYIARAAVVDQSFIPLPYLHLKVNTDAMVHDS